MNSEQTGPSEERPAKQVPPPPGWYLDKQGKNRWWDGVAWTDAVQAAPAASPAPNTGKKEPTSGVAVFGYVMAVIAPLIGFIVGLALIAKGDRSAVGVLLVSMGMGLLYLILIAGA